MNQKSRRYGSFVEKLNVLRRKHFRRYIRRITPSAHPTYVPYGTTDKIHDLPNLKYNSLLQHVTGSEGAMNDFWSDIGGLSFDNEASVENQLISPLLNALGYSLSEIRREYPVRFQEGKKGRPHSADYAVFSGSNCNRRTSLMVIEVKAPGESFDDAKLQAESYAANLRAPVYVLCDGHRLSVWQLQLSHESENILEIDVSQLSADRGKIESILGKSALTHYCNGLPHKSLLQSSVKFDNYVSSELSRMSKRAPSIMRTLHRSSAEGIEKIQSDKILLIFDGAMIVGPSGFGKSTLAQRIHTQALQRTWQDQTSQLSFEIQLPELAESSQGIAQYVLARLSPHCPFVTISYLRELFQSTGAILLCDGYDRIAPVNRLAIEAELKNTLRDFPKVKIFLFSRINIKPTLPLEIVEIAELSYEQKNEFRELFANGLSHPEVRYHLPVVLENLCWHPLLLQLICKYLILHKRPPKRMIELFESWLSTVISARQSSATASIQLEMALSQIAMATVEKPLSINTAITLLKNNAFNPDIFDELLACDAIVVNGKMVEVQHESLADYLRALQTSSFEGKILQAAISSTPLRPGSLFPQLLMSTLENRDAQQILWARISKLHISDYLNALRFQPKADFSESTPTELVKFFLEDVLSGCSEILDSHFIDSKQALTKAIAGNFGELAISGNTSGETLLGYQFGTIGDAFPNRVNIGGMIENHWPYYCCDLIFTQNSEENGRILGATRLRDALFKLIESRNFSGNKFLANERSIGRLRLLKNNYSCLNLNPENSLANIEANLLPHSGETVTVKPHAFDHIWFEINDLIADIKFLRGEGFEYLDQWWKPHGGLKIIKDRNEDEMRHLLDEHYRRVQHVYREIVFGNFSKLAKYMRTFTLLPYRSKLTIVPSAFDSQIIHFQWHPVKTENEAGADVTFSLTPPQTDWDYLWKEISKELVELGRPSNRIGPCGWGQFPIFDGDSWNGPYDGETSVMREVMELLKEDIKELFKELPEPLLMGSDFDFF